MQSVDGALAVTAGIGINPSRGARKGHFEHERTWQPTAADDLGAFWCWKSSTQQRLFSASQATARYVKKESDRLREYVPRTDEQQLMHDLLHKRRARVETRVRS